jgi:hypothetical protein
MNHVNPKTIAGLGVITAIAIAIAAAIHSGQKPVG